MKIRFPFYAGLAVAVLLVYWIGTMNGASSARDNATTQSSVGLTALHAAFTHEINKRVAIETRHAAKFRELQLESDSLWSLIESIHGDTTTPTTRVDTLFRRAATIGANAVRECSVALTACQQARQLAVDRSNALDEQLKKQIEVSQCHINLLLTRLGCPSHSETFLGGAGIATLIQIWMRR